MDLMAASVVASRVPMRRFILDEPPDVDEVLNGAVEAEGAGGRVAVDLA